MRVYADAFSKIYDPSTADAAWYINDHTIIKGRDGWHLFGITHEEPAAPEQEVLCAHAVAKTLPGGVFQRQKPAFSADSRYGESVFWAPHVVDYYGVYHMFYCGGSLEGHESYRIMQATSTDLYHWERSANNPVVCDGYDARDPMVLAVGEGFILYYTCTTKPEGGHHCVRALKSPDLKQWKPAVAVYVDEQCGTWGGPCESPFVLEQDGLYYLFLCLCGDYNQKDYHETGVYVSEDPLDFSGKQLVGHIHAHAAEVIRADGKLYVTRCGWGECGVYLAELHIEK